MTLRPLLYSLFLLLTNLLQPVFLCAQESNSSVRPRDTSREAVHQAVLKAFQAWKDSMEGVRIKREVARNGQSLQDFLKEMAKREKAEKRQKVFLIGIGALLLTMLALGFARRKKRRPVTP